MISQLNIVSIKHLKTELNNNSKILYKQMLITLLQMLITLLQMIITLLQMIITLLQMIITLLQMIITLLQIQYSQNQSSKKIIKFKTIFNRKNKIINKLLN